MRGSELSSLFCRSVSTQLSAEAEPFEPLGSEKPAESSAETATVQVCSTGNGFVLQSWTCSRYWCLPPCAWPARDPPKRHTFVLFLFCFSFRPSAAVRLYVRDVVVIVVDPAPLWPPLTLRPLPDPKTPPFWHDDDVMGCTLSRDGVGARP